MRRNLLTTAQVLRVSAWLQAHTELLRQDYAAAVAEKAAADLGFFVNAGNVLHIAAAAGLETKRSLQRAAKPAAAQLFDQDVMDRLDRLEAMVKVLAVAVEKVQAPTAEKGAQA